MVFRALIVLFSYGYNIEIIQNNLGNFSNVAFLPYASFFAGQRRVAWFKWPIILIVNTQCILTPENVRLQVH